MTTFGFLVALVAVSGFAAAIVYAAVMDVLTMTISNRLVVALLVAFLGLAPLAGWSTEEIAYSLAAAMAVFFASAALFALGWIGGGDGKLATVATLWLGSASAFDFLTYTALFGGLCGVFLLLLKKAPLPRALLRRAWIARHHAAETGIPYAVALGLAALVVLPGTPWAAGLSAQPGELLLMPDIPAPNSDTAAVSHTTHKDA